MEVEVKIRLPHRAAYDRVLAALGPCHRAGFEQENLFFDGPGKELNSQRIVLRLRMYDTDKKAVITIKGKQLLVNGIGRATEVEEEVPVPVAIRFRAEPNLMLRDSPLVKETAEKLGVSSLVCMGGFLNRRDEFAWEGLVLELDETRFEQGTLYEIECETDKPEAARDRLEAFLGQLGIPYGYSSASKFANFIKKTLD